MNLKRTCGIASWYGAVVGALAKHFGTLVSITMPAFSRLLPLRGSRSAYRAKEVLRNWIRVFVISTLVPSEVEADLHQSSVVSGLS